MPPISDSMIVIVYLSYSVQTCTKIPIRLNSTVFWGIFILRLGQKQSKWSHPLPNHLPHRVLHEQHHNCIQHILANMDSCSYSYHHILKFCLFLHQWMGIPNLEWCWHPKNLQYIIKNTTASCQTLKYLTMSAPYVPSIFIKSRQPIVPLPLFSRLSLPAEAFEQIGNLWLARIPGMMQSNRDPQNSFKELTLDVQKSFK